MPAKFAGGSGREAMALLADPVLLLRYKAEWDVWLEELPLLARAPEAAGGACCGVARFSRTTTGSGSGSWCCV